MPINIALFIDSISLIKTRLQGMIKWRHRFYKNNNMKISETDMAACRKITTNFTGYSIAFMIV